MPKDQLFAAQIELLMRNLATGTVLAHAAGVVAALLLLWNTVEPQLLFAWVTVLFAVLLLRSWHMRLCLEQRMHRANARRVCWQLLVGISVTGLCWFIAYVHVATVAPVTIQYIFLLIVVLIASLSLGPAVVVREYYVFYLLCSLYPIAWWNLVHYWDYPFNSVVGFMLLLATAVLLVVCNRVYNSYRNMIELNWAKETLAEESAALAADLRQRNDELTEARHRLSEQARVDELTGLFNRRALNERLEAELKRSTRFGTPLAVIMLDVDYFKNYNDNYGHQAGDKVLQKLAEILVETANRAGDTVARYGGEEFMLVLPGTDVLAARAVALRIQQALDSAAIEHAYSSVAPCITVSQGLAYARPEERLTSHELISLADEALYSAKAEGRNTIKSA